MGSPRHHLMGGFLFSEDEARHLEHDIILDVFDDQLVRSLLKHPILENRSNRDARMALWSWRWRDLEVFHKCALLEH